MSLTEMPAELLNQALAMTELTNRLGVEHVGEMFSPWIAANPEDAAKVMIALAYLADTDKPEKEAHAAYTRGERSDVICDMERRYQRKRKRRTRDYLRKVDEIA